MGAPVTAGVARVIGAMVEGKAELDAELGKQVAGAIAKNFKVKPEEVAILRVTGGGKHMEFIVPARLAQVGSIPMTSTNSLAVRTARDKRAEAINNFGAAQHPTVFEAVRLAKGESSEPIQKIISVPILVGGHSAGVIQVSRKGKNPASAGPDFTQKDVEELTQVAAALAGCFQPK
ncbi:MAG TPA: GAF domain-containing protein [Candidatus Xenobia bacterium]|nr:GAF domain-containing protein [Candidatus Xenobia bacterium]